MPPISSNFYSVRSDSFLNNAYQSHPTLPIQMHSNNIHFNYGSGYIHQPPQMGNYHSAQQVSQAMGPQHMIQGGQQTQIHQETIVHQTQIVWEHRFVEIYTRFEVFVEKFEVVIEEIYIIEEQFETVND